MVYLLCKTQADDRKISIDEFEERLYGDDTALLAGDAFLEELHDFFLKLGQRGNAALVKTNLELMKSSRAKLGELIDSGQLDSAMGQLSGQIDSVFNSISQATNPTGQQSSG